MNLRPLGDGQLDAKMRGFSKRYRIILLQPESGFRSLIVIGNGEPDDLVSCLVSHHLDGNETAGILAPQKKGTAAFQFVSQYLRAYPKIERELFLLDQEAVRCEMVSSELEQQLRKQNINFSPGSAENEGRLCIYECSTGTKKFEIVLVLNGLDAIPTSQHVVEDHLLMAAHRLNLMEIPDKGCEPKTLWRALSEEQKNSVFQRLADSKRLCDEVLPQQVKGFGRLKLPLK